MALSRLFGGWIAVVVWLLLWELVASRWDSARGERKLRRARVHLGEALLLTLFGALWFGSLGAGAWWLVFGLVGALREWPVAGRRPSSGRSDRRRVVLRVGRTWWLADCWPGGSRRHDRRRDRAPGALLRHRADPAGHARPPGRSGGSTPATPRWPSGCVGSWQRASDPTARSPAARCRRSGGCTSCSTSASRTDSPAIVRPLAWLLDLQDRPGSFHDGCDRARHARQLCQHYLAGFFAPAPPAQRLAPVTLPTGKVFRVESAARFAISCLALRAVLRAGYGAGHR